MTVRQITSVLDDPNNIVIGKYGEASPSAIFKGRAFDLTDDNILSADIVALYTGYDREESCLIIVIAE